MTRITTILRKQIKWMEAYPYHHGDAGSNNNNNNGSINQLKQEFQGPLQEEAKVNRLLISFTQFEEHWPEIFAPSLGAGLFNQNQRRNETINHWLIEYGFMVTNFHNVT